MTIRTPLLVATCLVAPMLATSAFAQPTRSVSAFVIAPNDPAAVTVAAKGDGVADDTAAVQAAIDAAGKPGGGIVFLPAGRYRISRTLYMWPGVRLFGVGKRRPVIVLAPNTRGFVGSRMVCAKANKASRVPLTGSTCVAGSTSMP